MLLLSITNRVYRLLGHYLFLSVSNRDPSPPPPPYPDTLSPPPHSISLNLKLNQKKGKKTMNNWQYYVIHLTIYWIRGFFHFFSPPLILFLFFTFFRFFFTILSFFARPKKKTDYTAKIREQQTPNSSSQHCSFNKPQQSVYLEKNAKKEEENIFHIPTN